MGNLLCCPTGCPVAWARQEPPEARLGNDDHDAYTALPDPGEEQTGSRGVGARDIGTSASVPLPCSAASTTAAAAALLQKFKAASSSSLPPSVEDERQYMRASWDRILTAQRNAPDECVLCLEEFSIDAPAVRTLCNCGVNRHHYHLACLLAWRRRSGKTTCPVCDEELFYEESAPAVQGHSAPSTNPLTRPTM
ncbi:E3 ubiquitin-protein ligase listerin [Hondaea fermentalgiana]|uniref:RING-type E3 ubiquitin transferase n=1 Tax=Hondaea fermentalgiana TaxID=2315210 RepID=A0A2R5GM56_9STRA|nr:E3 ubiquitin-protein ligase listerin [Hondaea fermentalgiana]|eukprot:GBG31976.1 E3 ubiquitin-protein ligase listerin [Hondaea fermentalgiana]